MAKHHGSVDEYLQIEVLLVTCYAKCMAVEVMDL
jgi:hypothetical protein